MELTLGSLFTGTGALDLAIEQVFGADLVWTVDNSDGPMRVIDYQFPGVHNYADVTKVNWWGVIPVDIISGGSPCTDVSLAGRREGMVEGTRSNLWVEMRNAVAAIRPRYVVWENVYGATSAQAASEVELTEGRVGTNLRALGRVLGDLADLGYDARWCGVRASDVGAPHPLPRVFVLATTDTDDERRVWSRSAANQLARGAQARPSNVPERPDKFGIFTAAVNRWERLTRPAPDPFTEAGTVSVRFKEWMMGLPDGWVTDVPKVSFTQCAQMLGNGVVPQQAAHALRLMLSSW